MIYMTTDEWKEISKIIEEKNFGKLAEEIAIRAYDLDISEQELDEIINKKEKKNMKNLLDKHYFDRLRGGVLSDEDIQLLLEVIGPMLVKRNYIIVKKDF